MIFIKIHLKKIKEVEKEMIVNGYVFNVIIKICQNQNMIEEKDRNNYKNQDVIIILFLNNKIHIKQD